MEVLIYLGIMLAVILVWFLALKRPVYEAVLVSFFALVAAVGFLTPEKIFSKEMQDVFESTQTSPTYWEYLRELPPVLWKWIEKALSTSLLYSMVAFVAMSIVLTKTKVVDSCIAVILSLIGRVTGGAGYTAVVASAFMGALSGSGPGNVMATGALTIPAMKRSGFPAHLAANIESNASYMGNMIPPSANIVAALGAYMAFVPNSDITTGQFWMVLWGIAFWFILQRIVMVWAFCKYYKVKPMSKDELPDLKETLKAGWQGLLLPVIILLPFVLDFIFKDGFFTDRLGEAGAGAFSSAILLFIGGVATMYTCLIAKDKKVVTPKSIADMFAKGVKTIAPTIGVCVFGYMIGALFTDLKVAEGMADIITQWNFGKFGTVLAVCVITCFMGMVIPGSSMVAIFGTAFISVLSAVGCNPLLVAAMLPCICGVMCGITPPLGLGMYAGMTIAESDFSKTFKNNLWWVAAQFILQVVVLMGWLPIFGL